jgi:hypothetical protein
VFQVSCMSSDCCALLIDIQIPILIVSFLLVAWKVNIPLPDEIQSQTLVARLRRIE